MTGQDNGYLFYLDRDTCPNFGSDIYPGWDQYICIGFGAWRGEKRGGRMDSQPNLGRLSSIVHRLLSIVSGDEAVLHGQAGSFGAGFRPQLGKDVADVLPDSVMAQV